MGLIINVLSIVAGIGLIYFRRKIFRAIGYYKRDSSYQSDPLVKFVWWWAYICIILGLVFYGIVGILKVLGIIALK